LASIGQIGLEIHTSHSTPKAVKVLLLSGNLLEKQWALSAASWHTFGGFYQQVIHRTLHTYSTQGASLAAIGQ